MHENRETSGAPRWSPDRGRPEKAQSRNAGMHASEESDHAILPMNQPNNEGQPSAEVGEGRAWTKENIVRSDTFPTQCGSSRVPRIARCAAIIFLPPLSKVRAVCGSTACTDLRGGRRGIGVPTATTENGTTHALDLF